MPTDKFKLRKMMKKVAKAKPLKMAKKVGKKRA